MKRLLLLLCSIAPLFLQAQYTVIYENSFRNWAPGQGWVMLSNDSVSIQPRQLSRSVTAGVPVSTLEMLDNMIGVASYDQWHVIPGSVPGNSDKVMISPPLALGNNPYAIFYSKYKLGSAFDVWVVANPNDTTLNGLTTNALSCNHDGFNSLNLNPWANTTIRLAFRFTGLNAYALIDNLKVLNKTGLATIPDSCFRSYLQTIVPAAFVGNQLDYLHPVVLNTREVVHPGSCIQSLEGLQHFPFLSKVNLNNCQISYIPPDPMYYLDSMKIKSNLLPYLPDMPMATVIILDNNLLQRIPNVFNQYADSFTCINNSIFDCLPGTNRFVEGNFVGNVGVNFGSFQYYDMEYDLPMYNSGPVDCRDNWGIVKGKVYYDMNQSGAYETTDPVLPNQRIDFVQSHNVFTTVDGKYGFYADTGNIDLNVTDLPAHFTCATPLSTHVAPGEIISYDFRITTQTTVKDMGVTLSALNSPRTGDNLNLMLSVENYGTMPGTGTVKMYLPPGYVPVINNNATIVNDTLVWPVNISPFATVSNIIQIEANYPAQQTIIFTAVLEYAGDAVIANNTDTANVLMRDSTATWAPWGNGFPYDPNNKIVSTPQVNPGFDDYLYYTINFENIGTGNASRVKVRDFLSSKFDMNTIELVGSSHPCNMVLAYDTIIDFVIYPITLTPKSVDSVNSHGHIIYRIKPLNAMLASESIENLAQIYFDNEAPIQTNTAVVWTGSLNAAYKKSDSVQCGTAKIKYTDVSPGSAVSRQWIFQGGSPATSGAEVVQVQYGATGTYQVTLIVNAPEYTDTLIDWVNIIVDTLPSAVITKSGPTIFCKGDSVTLTAPIGPNYTYLWRVWPEDTLYTQSVVSYGGSYSLTVTNQNGCVGTNYQSVTASQPQPVIKNNTNCQNPVATLATTSTFTSYAWSTGATTPTITAGQYGLYYITVTDNVGCTGRDTFEFVYHANPTPAINGPTMVCPDEDNYSMLTLTQSYETYKWSYYNATDAGIMVGVGTYTVTVTDAYGCSGTASHTIGYHPYIYVVATGTDNSICQGQVATIQASNINTGSVITQYLWSTGSTDSSITVAGSGNYEVTAVNMYGCVSTGSYRVSVIDNYMLEATAIDTGLCPGQTIQLNAEYLPGYLTGSSAGCTAQTGTLGTSTAQPNFVGVFDGSWNSKKCRMLYKASELQSVLGAGAKLLTGVSLQMGTIVSAGPFQNVVIKIGNTGGSEYLNWANNLAEVYSAASYTPVAGWNQFTLTAPFYWDGMSDLQVEFCYFNPTSGSTGVNKLLCTSTAYVGYSQTSGTTSACATNTGSGYNIYYHPNIRFNHCPPPAVLVPFEVPAFTWQAISYNGATITTPTLASTMATTDSVTAFVAILTDNEGCLSVDTVVFEPVAAYPVSITASKTHLCVGETAQLCAVSGANTYQWNTGSSASCVSVSNPGLYKVTASDGGGCPVTAMVSIQKTNVDSSFLQATAQFCPNDSVALCAPSVYTTYQWSSGAAVSCVQAKAVGTYRVTVTDAGGCVGADSISVTQFTVGQASIAASKNYLCIGDTAQLCVISAAGAYNWNNGSSSPCVSVTTPGLYNITANDSNGCSVTASVTIQKTNVDSSFLQAAIQLCPTDSVLLCAPSGWSSYQWSNGTGSNCLNAKTIGTYKLTVTDAQGCVGSDSVSVTNFPIIPLAIDVTKYTLCDDYDAIFICAPNGFTGYIWSDSSTTSCLNVIDSGWYWLTASDTNGCRVESGHEYINRAVAPVITTVGSALAVVNSTYNTFQWYLNGAPVSGAQGQYHTPLVTGYYKAYVVDTNFCGLYTDSIYIVVNSVTGISTGSVRASVYPNPSGGKFNVEVESAHTGLVNFKVTNVLGEVLLSKLQALSAGKSNYLIDLTDMPAGVYLVNIKIGDKTVVERLIRQ